VTGGARIAGHSDALALTAPMATRPLRWG
jgi:hypothetical protein